MSPCAKLIVCERYIQILPSLNTKWVTVSCSQYEIHLWPEEGINFIANFYSQSTHIHDCENARDIFRGEKITASIAGLHEPKHVTPIQDSFLPPTTNSSQEAAVESIMHVATYFNS